MNLRILLGNLVLRMNRRDRILTAISHKEPDRVPISFDFADKNLENKVLNYYGAKSMNELYGKSGIDAFSVWHWSAARPIYIGPKREGVEKYDETYGCWGKVGQHFWPLQEKTLDEYLWPRADHFDFSAIKKDLLTIKQMDMTTAVGHAGVGWCHHVQMRGYENALYDVLDENYMEEYQSRNREFNVAYFETLFKHAEGQIDIIRADEDLGGQQAMMISPSMWRKYYKPLWKEIFDLCHQNHAKVWMHSCGYCRDVVQDFIEVGVDILNPVPPYVKNSDPLDMKRTYGKYLTFDGAVDQINVLINGTKEDVRREVKLRLEQMAPGGGYIVGPSQGFTEDVPFENVIAFFNSSLEYGNY